MSQRNKATDRQWKELLTRHWSEADARVVLQAWRSSGQSMSAFARKHGIGVSRLSGWKQRVGGATEHRGAEQSGSPSSEDLEFKQVLLTGTCTTPAAMVRVGRVEIEIHDPSRVDGAWISQLASALGAGS